MPFGEGGAYGALSGQPRLCIHSGIKGHTWLSVAPRFLMLGDKSFMVEFE